MQGSIAIVQSPYHSLFFQLDRATRNFDNSCLIGVSALGHVFRCKIPPSKELVAVKRLTLLNPVADLRGHAEFLVDILLLSVLHHPNIMKLIGYCFEETERMIVYEYMQGESLKKCLYDHSRARPLNWNMRMVIALGAAKAFEFLHTKAEPVVIHRNVKPSSILLATDFEPKLSGFEHAIFGTKTEMSKFFLQKSCLILDILLPKPMMACIQQSLIYMVLVHSYWR